MQAVEAGFYIDFTPDGEPYLGFAYNGNGLALSIMLASRMSIRDFQSSFDRAANDLMKTKPKLAVAEGSLPNGIRVPEQ